MEFASFYETGGLYMHPITLFSIIAAAMIVRRGHALYKIVAGRGSASELTTLRRDDTVTRGLLLIAVAIGVLGMLTGVMEAGIALTTVPAEQQWPAFVRVIAILPTPGIWALTCTLPLMLAHTVLQHLGTRLRLVPDTAQP